MTLQAWEYKALVPVAAFVEAAPMITKVVPSHDSRILSHTTAAQTVGIEIHFSVNMSCPDVTSSLSINSTTHQGVNASLDTSSVVCQSVDEDSSYYVGAVPTAWTYKANLVNVYEGVHMFTVTNATAAVNGSTNVCYLVYNTKST